MIIKEIYLENIRKYSQKKIFFPDEKKNNQRILILGPNGAGKTTILESLIFLFRGFIYGNSPQRFIKKGASKAIIRGYFFSLKSETNHEISASISIKGSSSISLNRKEVKRELVRKIFDAYWFFPQDIELILGGDEIRRSFIDGLIKYFDSTYKKTISDYQTLVKARNEILLRAENESEVYNNKELDAIEEVLSKTTVEILKKRTRVISELNNILEWIYKEFISDKTLRIDYKTTLKISDKLKDSINESLFVSRGTDFRTGSTSVGPHRDHISLIYEGRDARYEASYGERKLMALALKVSGYKLILEKKSGEVVFLADDLLSELDGNHKITALKLLSMNCPSLIMTATEIESNIVSDGDIQRLNLEDIK
ncbi:MAG: DNA replication and repair protein RecF [Actinobacteria bacterium]|nr:DNA replication and repair protein RecF [Actinomycetota bacterium]